MKDPVITFALPRSGSTFLIRLLNKSTNKNTNETVNYNGEFDILEMFCPIARMLIKQDLYGVKSIKELSEDKEFLSHYHFADTNDAINYLGNFWRMYCGGTNNWGWKNVNYGIHNNDKFIKQIETLISVYPNVKFIFLDRDINDVVKSMKASMFWSMKGEKDLILRVQNQIDNYQKVLSKYRDRSVLLTYESLIKYDTFESFTNKLDWTITENNYSIIANNKRKDDVGTKTEEIRDVIG